MLTGVPPMAMTDLPLVTMLRSKMQWHQERQKVLAENVANANTPKFQPRDLQLPSHAGGAGAATAGGVQVERTNPMHLAASTVSGGDAGGRSATKFETRPSGNAVSLEDEVLKIGENQSDYQLAATMYSKSLALLRSAAGVRGA